VRLNKFGFFLICVLLAFSPSIGMGQDRPTGFYDFAGGLNTADNWSFVKPNQAQQCHNWLLDDPVGALTVRPGYHAVTDSLANHTRIWSIYSHKFPTGEGFLFQSLQSKASYTDSGVACDIYVSGNHGYAAVTDLGGLLYPEALIWLSWLDQQFLFSRHNVPRVVTGGPSDFRMDYLIPPAVGQLVAEAYSAPAGALSGEYRYSYAFERCDSPGVFNPCGGTLSLPVLVEDGRAILHNFAGPVSHTYVYGDTVGGTIGIYLDTCVTEADSTRTLVLRTRANRNDFGTDSLFVVDTFYIDNTDPASVSYTDNVPDSALQFYITLADFEAAYQDTIPPWHVPTEFAAYRRPGQVRVDSAYWSSGISANAGLCPVVVAGDTCRFTSYFVICLDTIDGRVSDSAAQYLYEQRIDTTTPPDWEWKAPIDTMWLTIPAPSSDRYVRLLYRAHAKVDSINADGRHFTYTDYYLVDTVLGDTITFFEDTTSYTTLITKPTYERTLVETHFNGAIVHEARMWAWDDHRVYASNPDTAGAWGVFDNIEFDMDDGDRIIGLSSQEGYIVVYKTNSMWILWTDDGEIQDRKKVARGMGMISPHTLDQYLGANIFLGLQGVFSETDGKFKDNAPDRTFLSDPIKNLLVREPDQMAGASGLVLGNRYFLSLPGTDTTFVYFFDAGGWGTFGFDFFDACRYDTVNADDYTVFNEMCFIRDDDERVFVWDSNDTTDNGLDFDAVWHKTHIQRDPWGMQSLRGAVLQASAGDSDSVVVTTTTERAAPLGTMVFDSLGSYVYRKRYVAPVSNRLFHHMDLTITAPNRSALTINALDLEFGRAGQD